MGGLTGKRSENRSRIIQAAAQLLREHGPAAVTTRGVAEHAGVQPPAIYRLFGDKDSLLDEVAESVMAEFAASKAAKVEAAQADSVDPLEDLYAGWRSQIEFGLANPALFRLLSDPARVARSPAAQTGRRVLEARVHRVAVTGRLRVSEPRAVAMIQAAGTGVIQTLLATPAEQRDPELPDAVYQAVLAHILTDPSTAPPDGTLATAVAFRAITPELTVLSAAERQLLDDWLDRVVNAL
ncbi:TetR/AcrR family transcriptional regulator [Acidiferrimicrobium sp. IK]|uniref:TetR/AcrR family transcriptional regulator n=1 Tax=Acidiferrimicrobium sp. IK TaxID=2871700 RepID=UPI0021CB23D3|nr:TetR/AcrR family transcriptional regulator [Acidiferrimicrobium sp. IK]MCU4186545.1 TetR/AcrR family transcriptional regulator [Acidiferrimicrobium sp. IK]